MSLHKSTKSKESLRPSKSKDRISLAVTDANSYLVAIICNLETMIGFLLCGFAKTNEDQTNFLIVDNSEFMSQNIINFKPFKFRRKGRGNRFIFLEDLQSLRCLHDNPLFYNCSTDSKDSEKMPS
ncbi:hypothetical protein ACFFRR_006385 [Megaselia abdita]